MAQPLALLVAHGYPSQPGPTEAAMQRLAGAVGAYLPGWQLRGATLAAPGALEQALDGLDAPLIYPFFMAEGWFTKTVLPQRLAQAGRPNLRQLPAFGSDPGLAALVAAQVQAACKAQGWQLQDSALLLAAHGSQRARASASREVSSSCARRHNSLTADWASGRGMSPVRAKHSASA